MIAVLAVMVACSMSPVDAGNYTVTDEAWFNMVVENFSGPGRNFTGKFVVALFGETVPMTVMNFVAITRGYERVSQVRRAGLRYIPRCMLSIYRYNCYGINKYLTSAAPMVGVYQWLEGLSLINPGESKMFSEDNNYW